MSLLSSDWQGHTFQRSQPHLARHGLIQTAELQLGRKRAGAELIQSVSVDQAQPTQPGVLPQREELGTMTSQAWIGVSRAVGLGLTGQTFVRNDPTHGLNDQRL